MQGTITALITPFCADGALDIEGLEQLIIRQLDCGVNGLLVLGTTGEAPTLTKEEKQRVIQTAVKLAKGRVPVWVGTGSYATVETIERTKEAEAFGADIALVVTPYYNKPSQEGIFRHFEAIAHATSIPIIVYNIAGRCVCNIETETLQRIAALPNVIGVKEASGSLLQASEVMSTLGNEFLVFSGDDALTVPMMSLGASGSVSVVSNLVPSEMVRLTESMLDGNYGVARERHHRLFPLFRASFLEVNPVAIKAAMELCGLPAGKPRLPLCELQPENLAHLLRVLEQLELVPCRASL